MSQQLDFFGLLGIDNMKSLEREGKKEKEKKKASVSKTETGKKPKAVPTESYDCPIRVRTGYFKDFSLGADAFGGKDKGILPGELKVAINKAFPYLSLKFIDLVKDKNENNTVCAFLKESAENGKIMLPLTEKSRALFTKELDLTPFMTEGECTVSVSTLEKSLLAPQMCKIQRDGDLILVLPGSSRVWDSEELHLPFVFSLPGGTKEYTITSEDVMPFLSLKSANDDAGSADEEETGEEEIGEETDDSSKKQAMALTKVKANVLVKVLESKLPTFRDGLWIYKNEFGDDKKTSYTVRFEPKRNHSNPTGASVPKKKMYKTEGMTISLLWDKFPISPEMFGGKKEIEAKDIVSFLNDSDHPEYREDNVLIEEDEKIHYLIVRLKGSSKGATSCSSLEEALRESSEKDFLIARYGDFRFEKNPMFTVSLDEKGNCDFFKWNLPKIPSEMVSAISEFFKEVSMRFNTEALARLFFGPENQRYEIIVPRQTCSFAEVTNDEVWDETPQHFCPLEIHSHGKISAFFSGTDNRDEKASRVFGVFGGVDSEEKICFRVVSGGRSHCLSEGEMSLVFSSDGTEDISETPETLFLTWLDKAQVY